MQNLKGKEIGMTSFRIELDQNKGFIPSSICTMLFIFSFEILCAINKSTTKSNE